MLIVLNSHFSEGGLVAQRERGDLSRLQLVLDGLLRGLGLGGDCLRGSRWVLALRRGVGMGEVMGLGEQVLNGRVALGLEVGYGERSVQVVFLI